MQDQAKVDMLRDLRVLAHKERPTFLQVIDLTLPVFRALRLFGDLAISASYQTY